MGKIFFDAAPIGDPNDRRGQKLLTTRVSASHDPKDGMLHVLVHDTEVEWIECYVPHAALVLCGLSSYGVTDAEEMLRLLDKALAQVPEWRDRRKCILPRPAPTPESEEATITVEA